MLFPETVENILPTASWSWHFLQHSEMQHAGQASSYMSHHSPTGCSHPAKGSTCSTVSVYPERSNQDKGAHT